MTPELLQVTTADGVILDGVCWHPVFTRTHVLQADAFLLVHGTGSNFYARGLLDRFAKQAVAGGLPVLRINTRGHDGVATLPGTQGPVKGGAAYEVLSDAQFDLAAWLDWLRQRGWKRVVLVGHSVGAVKSLDFAARAPHAAVVAVVAISPPRFQHAKFQKHPQAEAFRRDWKTAMQLVESGRGLELFEASQPLPLVITAEGYVAKYGPHDAYDFVPWLPKINVPVLAILGTQSIATNPAFDRLDEQLRAVALRCRGLKVETVEGANINYAGHLTTPYELAHRWLAGLASATKH